MEPDALSRPASVAGAPDGQAAATPAWPLTCTACGEGLSRQGGALVCPRRHSFDIAREGYVNLLGGRRAPRTLGDSPEMLRARRAFLDAGHYAPLASAIVEHARDHLRAHGAALPAVVCDVGCGEGYYLAAVRRGLATDLPCGQVACYGIDAAREAARMGARRHHGVTFVVADAWRRLPLADGSVDVLLDVFAPRNPPEFARVLAADGLAIVVIPGAEHLVELRRRWGLLDIEEDKHGRLVAQMAGFLRLLSEQSLRYSGTLGGSEARDVVAMGPSARHLGPEVLAAICLGPPTSVTIAFDLLLFGARER